MAVSDFGAKVLSGEETSPEEWQQHLREVHRRLAGVTSAVCSRHGTQEGKTSYQVLADAAVVGARGLDRPVDVLEIWRAGMAISSKRVFASSQGVSER